jgi:hypothetical protein
VDGALLRLFRDRALRGGRRTQLRPTRPVTGIFPPDSVAACLRPCIRPRSGALWTSFCN